MYVNVVCMLSVKIPEGLDGDEADHIVFGEMLTKWCEENNVWIYELTGHVSESNEAERNNKFAPLK